MAQDTPTILYVEDDPLSRRLMSMLLRGRMKLAHVTILENSQHFLSNLEALDPKPNLILLDIQMKPYDGFAMLEMLRQLTWAKTMPIVALTASVMVEEVQRLKEAGFNGCIGKPINIETFPDILNSILAGEVIWHMAD
jgi:two-component system cell cycle response regulator DivK